MRCRGRGPGAARRRRRRGGRWRRRPPASPAHSLQPKGKRQRHPHRLGQGKKSQPRKTRNSGGLRGTVAAYGIRRRRPASSVGGAAGPIGVARWKQRSGGAAASSARPIGSVPSGGVAGTRAGRCGGSRGRGRRAARRSWGGRSDGRGETETEGTCLTVVVGLRCGCLCELDSLRRGVRGRPATAGLSSCRICSYIFSQFFNN